VQELQIKMEQSEARWQIALPLLGILIDPVPLANNNIQNVTDPVPFPAHDAYALAILFDPDFDVAHMMHDDFDFDSNDGIDYTAGSNEEK
jgi:hypothetical protein